MGANYGNIVKVKRVENNWAFLTAEDTKEFDKNEHFFIEDGEHGYFIRKDFLREDKWIEHLIEHEIFKEHCKHRIASATDDFCSEASGQIETYGARDLALCPCREELCPIIKHRFHLGSG